MQRISIILASLCTTRGALVAKDKDHYVRYWARNRDKGRCNAKHCEFFRDFGPIDVACRIEIDHVGAPMLSLVFNDGQTLSMDARDASSITRFAHRPALCEYATNRTGDVALLMAAPAPSDLFRLFGPFLNKLLFATDAGLRPLLWIGDMTRGVRDCSTAASAGPPGGECSDHAVKMPATLAALANPEIKGLHYLELDAVIRYPWTISDKLLQEHQNGYSAVAFSRGANSERFGRLRWQVNGDRFYARDSTIGRQFIANWFNNRCMFKDAHSLWHTVLEFAVKEGCIDDKEGEMYRMRYGDVSRVTDGTTKLILDCAVIDAKCPRFPFSNVGGHTCDTRLPRLLDDVRRVPTDVRLLGIEGRDRSVHPWRSTRESWTNLDVGACATRLAAPGRLGPVKTVVVYSGPTDLGNQLYLDNFEYFLTHGLPSSRGVCVPGVAVILVLTTETLARYAGCLRAYNATCGEIRTVTRINRCFDMESARLALTSDESFRRLGLGTDYEKVVFVNCGMLGPLLPGNGDRFWASHFTDRINARVKLVGPTINCGGKRDVHHAHVQSRAEINTSRR